MRFLQWLRGAEAGRDRSVALRIEAALWMAPLLAPLVASGVLLVLMDGLSMATRAMVLGAGLLLSTIIAWWGGKRAVASLGTAFDLLSAMREGDYSMRGRAQAGSGPLQDLVAGMNALTEHLRNGRRKRSETSRFLGKTLVALDNAVFVVDDRNILTFVNRSGRRLIGAERTAIVGRDVGSLGLDVLMGTADGVILSHRFAAVSGRWALRRMVWYSDGREHTIVMLHDLSAALGKEERLAWQRLIRVLSHELNNSLAPIGSLAGSLSTLLDTRDRATIDQELRLGLEVIGRRAQSLARFLASYGRMARLPPLQPHPFRLDISLRRLARLEQRRPVDVLGSAPIHFNGDEDQLGQAFINLLRNAAEATFSTGGGVRVDWRVDGEYVRVTIEDDGIGLPPSDGMFVPFFTTKPQGSGIGLTLTRLIIEAHAGTVDLVPRRDAKGAVATVRLPLRSGPDGTVRFRTMQATDSDHVG